MSTESYEERRIVAAEDGLSSVSNMFKLTGPAAEVAVEIVYGAVELSASAGVASSVSYDAVLPVTLAAGQTHELAIRTTLRGVRLAPLYIFSPLVDCALFELRIRFGPDALPAEVRRYDGVPAAVFADTTGRSEVGHPVPVDPAGEVQARFPATRVGYAYGFTWA